MLRSAGGRRIRRAMLVALAAAWPGAPLPAQSEGGALPLSANVRAGGRPDSTALSPSPAFGWPEVRGFALTAALGGLASLADQSMRDAARASGPQNSDALHALVEYGDYFGQPVSALLAVGLYGSGLYTKRPVIAKSGFRAMEAIAVSGVVTWFSKQVFGRARPEVSPDDPNDWEWGRGFGKRDGDFLSMPSGHTTAAFAFATAVSLTVAREAPEHARWVKIATFGTASVTAYARMYKDRHWLSDVTVGAGVGVVSALAIDRWHRTRANDPIDAFFLKPVLRPLPDGSTGVGLGLSFR